MRNPGMARLRTFLAIDLGKPLRDRCAALKRWFAPSADVKWVEVENLHVSLFFLGEGVAAKSYHTVPGRVRLHG